MADVNAELRKQIAQLRDALVRARERSVGLPAGDGLRAAEDTLRYLERKLVESERLPAISQDCRSCVGTGIIRSTMGMDSEWVPCPECRGVEYQREAQARVDLKRAARLNEMRQQDEEAALRARIQQKLAGRKL